MAQSGEVKTAPELALAAASHDIVHTLGDKSKLGYCFLVSPHQLAGDVSYCAY